jgi:hypothetical protein
MESPRLGLTIGRHIGLDQESSGVWESRPSIHNDGTSLIIYAVFVGGLVVGTIVVALTYVVSGGQATFDDYVNAFTLGFTVGAAIGGGVGLAYKVLGGARLGAAMSVTAAADDAVRLVGPKHAMGRGGGLRQVPDELLADMRLGEIRYYHRYSANGSGD